MVQLDSVQQQFPKGTPVCVRLMVRRRGPDTVTVIYGVVDGWAMARTGSWYAHGKNQRLWLPRLKLRKEDGEESLIVLDDATEIARIDAVKS